MIARCGYWWPWWWRCGSGDDEIRCEQMTTYSSDIDVDVKDDRSSVAGWLNTSKAVSGRAVGSLVLYAVESVISVPLVCPQIS